MRIDFIQPRLLQRVIKKNNQMILQTIIALIGCKKSEATHTDIIKTRTEIRVFMTIFQRETDSSLRFAKKRNKRLNNPRIPHEIRIQKSVFFPEKYERYCANFSEKSIHASAVESSSDGGGRICGSSAEFSQLSTLGSGLISSFGRSPRSILPSKKVRPSDANARDHFTVNPVGDVSLSNLPA